ncbi:MAG: hypothetical protein LBN21_08825, partial [Treponema sp.]|nr:hypothetical protein [Treponema sp.]
NDALDSILEDSGISPESGDDTIFLPVIFSETAGFISSSETVEAVYSGSSDAGHTNAITAQVMETRGNLRWRDVTGEEKQEVAREFSALCEKEVSDERVTLKIRELFDGVNWEVPGTEAGNGI